MQNRTMRVVLRYGLFQLPLLGVVVVILLVLDQVFTLPPWVIVSVVVLMVAKDVVMFPFTWRAYDTDLSGQTHSMIGARCITQEPLEPSGYIFIRGERWRAVAMDSRNGIPTGETVEVHAMHGLNADGETHSQD